MAIILWLISSSFIMIMKAEWITKGAHQNWIAFWISCPYRDTLGTMPLKAATLARVASTMTTFIIFKVRLSCFQRVTSAPPVLAWLSRWTNLELQIAHEHFQMPWTLESGQGRDWSPNKTPAPHKLPYVFTGQEAGWKKRKKPAAVCRCAGSGKGTKRRQLQPAGAGWGAILAASDFSSRPPG